MIKNKLITIILIAVHFSCLRTTKFNLNPIQDQTDWTIKHLGKLSDPLFNDSTDLNSILSFKTIDLKGNINPVKMDEGLALYKKNMKDKNPTLYPIFEIKNSPHVILPVYGEGLWDKIWGEVIVNKETLEIININFGHFSETPMIGDRIRDSIFTSQFIGKTINIKENNFALYQNEKKVIEGNHRIDGISGATTTSAGAIKMLNEDLTKYTSYFRK
jgi:Na+-transporting NADH:ubiquinone oxidoreductase subunit C